jgi:Cdc6-like AAA superfamily ATPase
MDISNADIWTEKYRPKCLSDYYISKKQIDVVKTWMCNYVDHNDDIKPFLILYGTAGIGKTTLAHLILKKYNYEVIECNASDFRSKKNLQDMIGQIGTVTICTDNFENDTKTKNKNNTSIGDKDGLFKRTAVIMDEIDGIDSRGSVNDGLSTFIQLTEVGVPNKFKYPIICIANDGNIWANRINNLKTNGNIISFLLVYRDL